MLTLVNGFVPHVEERPGLYIFTNTVGSRSYIGTSSNVAQAVAYQVRDLQEGVHSNSALQSFYNHLEGDIHLQAFYTSNLHDAKIMNMRMAVDPNFNSRIINPFFRKMSKKESLMILTLAQM